MRRIDMKRLWIMILVSSGALATGCIAGADPAIDPGDPHATIETETCTDDGNCMPCPGGVCEVHRFVGQVRDKLLAATSTHFCYLAGVQGVFGGNPDNPIGVHL